ncbi:MAG: alpha/beta hydrolase, partial [Acidobacteriota bacterium]
MLRTSLVGLAAILLTLLVAGLLYSAVSTSRDRARHPPPGQPIDVGGHSLHLRCAGDGGPAVFLEA